MSPSREDLVDLVARIVSGDYASEREADEMVETFTAAVLHPRASDLIFYWDREFDEEPTPDQIVGRAMAYRPIESY